jgi:uroporphyrinogen-III synthase
MSAGYVVVTRPLAQARPFADRVAALGRNVVVFPLLDIQPLDDATPLRDALAGLRNYAMVAFVSPNAIDAVFSILSDWPREVAIAVMGNGSRQVLARYGVTEPNAVIYSPSDPKRTDSETLVQALDLSSVRGARVLIIRGENGREFLADALRAAGAEVTQVPAYRRQAPEMNDECRTRLTALLDSVNDWVITSSEALHHLVSMAHEVCGESAVVKLQQQHIVCPHARIRETAGKLGFVHIVLTGSGDEQLLAALQSRP